MTMAYIMLSTGAVLWAIAEIVIDNVRKAWAMSQYKIQKGRPLADIAVDKAWEDIW